MAIEIGSARRDENGRYTNGKDGDQIQGVPSDHDTRGEVSFQNFYVHSKGWYILRPKSVVEANKIAEGMTVACNNYHIGYSQSERNDIIKAGVWSQVNCNCDCSSLVRACCIYAGFDTGNFSTATEVQALTKSGHFLDKIPYANGTTLYVGDVLVTKTKGHTVVVTSGNIRK